MITVAQNTMPPCVVQECQEGYYLIYNLSTARDSRLDAFLSADHKRLHVVGEKVLDDGSEQFLWSFTIPAMCDADSIQIEEKKQIYMIFVPRKVLPPVTRLFQHRKVAAA